MISIRPSSARLEETERLAKLGHWEWDEVENRCAYCSQGLARLAGVTPEEYLERTSSFDGAVAWAHPEDRDRFRKTVTEARGSSFAIEYRFVQANSEIIHVYQDSNPVFDKHGALIASHGYLQDITARIKSEVALRRGEALIKQAMRSARIGAWVWDDDKDECVYCSEELALLFGQSVEDYLATRGKGRGITARLHPDDQDRYRKCIDESVAANSRYTVEFREKVADGSYRHFCEVGEPTEDGPGQQRFSTGIVQDITELKDTEQALRISETALSRAQRQARIGSWRRDVSGNKLITCSNEYARIHGVAVEEVVALMGARIERVIHPDDRERIEAEFKRFDEGCLDYEIEYRIIRPDGEVRHLLEIGETLFDDDSQAVEQTGTVQDVTERKHAEKALQRSRDELELRVDERTAQLWEKERRFRDFAEASADWFWEMDANLRFTYMSENVERILGVPPEWHYGKTRRDILGDGYDREVWGEHLKALKEHRPFRNFEYLRVGEGIEPKWLRSSGVPRFDAEGNFIGYRGTGSDITDKQRAEEKLRISEEQLRQAQKMEAVGQLTGGVAHDFNNLLAVILGNAELLTVESGRDSPLVQAIVRASKRGAELTHRLLAFSRQQTLAARPTDLAELVVGMADLLKRTLGEIIETDIIVRDGLDPVMADPGQVENALLNLVINARDAMPAGGKLTIECMNASLEEAYVADSSDALAGDYVLLAVTDTGSGMTGEVKAHAFEPFFTTKEVGQGSGLGLSMIYGFAKQSGGQVTIYSEEGLGTTVKLYLPRSLEATRREKSSLEQDFPRGEIEVVLLIEDDPGMRALAVRMLEDLNYQVIDVPDAAAALGGLAGGKPVDLVLSDVVLPGGISGLELAEQARSAYPHLKIIFMSGYPAEASKRNGFFSSGQVLLNKPFLRIQLAKALREALRRSASA